MFRIESFLSARLFLAPQIFGQRIYFISNLSGHLSLYVMDYGGSVPEPLLPPNIALQNPELIGGLSFQVFPELGKILIMMDQDGDENYQPMLIPIQGGFPEPAFSGQLSDSRVHMVHADPRDNQVYFVAESRKVQMQKGYRADMASGQLVELAESPYGAYPAAAASDHQRVILVDSYTMGDAVVFLWQQGRNDLQLLFGTPLDQRQPGQEVPANGISAAVFSPDQRGIILLCALFSDSYGPAYLNLAGDESQVREVQVTGAAHQGVGEMTGIEHLEGDRYTVTYNIDGCSWLYEAVFDASALALNLRSVLAGSRAPLANGVLEGYHYDREGDRFALSFSTATSPTQIFTVEGPQRDQVAVHTSERVLGIDPDLLSPGEDASFTSHDGCRVSARLYMPSETLGFEGPRPVVYYIHGGPQSQERPDFAWFSMPLIQFLTLHGFAVFVPNVRGSSGYGLEYTRQVDRDWGGQDRLDHVHAMQELSKDPRVDASRAGVVGRSYGGYMTLTLAARHPELWSAAVDMFGPFDLLTFLDRIPETWKPYFRLALGDPQEDREFLVDRSPRTHIDQVTCPMLVIQGKNDPRVVERESRDLVEYLRGQGKEVDYLMFENEGHDVLKYENRVRCYTAITEFFQQHLKP
jgi:dipeptidyl aminopeptidase/acylaminoacyl peptidase